jgi:DnaJ-class molecular chaperone
MSIYQAPEFDKCPDCHGTGAIKDSEGWGWCERCGGRAIILALKKEPA